MKMSVVRAVKDKRGLQGRGEAAGWSRMSPGQAARVPLAGCSCEWGPTGLGLVIPSSSWRPGEALGTARNQVQGKRVLGSRKRPCGSSSSFHLFLGVCLENTQ